MQQGAGTPRPFKCIIDGWYLAYINFEWSGAVYSDVRTYSFYSNTFPDNAGNQNLIESESSPFIDAAFNGTYGPLYIRGDAHWNAEGHRLAADLLIEPVRVVIGQGRAAESTDRIATAQNETSGKGRRDVH